MKKSFDTPKKTSWEPVQKWYRSVVGEEGHYYHQHIIMPGLMRLMNLKPQSSSLLDLACGQGVLGRQVPEIMKYTGVDISSSLVKEARRQDKSSHHTYLVADITKPLNLNQKFSHCTIILALQNIEHPLLALKNAGNHIEKGGKLIIVLNHPCFRIPRQSSWQIDEQKKIQYRRLDRYFSPMEIPIQAHPSKGEQSASTLSFHYPISTYSRWLSDAGFFIEEIEEWCSDKVSTGKAAKMENRSREEFPLFLTICAEKRT